MSEVKAMGAYSVLTLILTLTLALLLKGHAVGTGAPILVKA